MQIGDLSRASGVNIETIRYYERIGLLPLPARQANGRRSYGVVCGRGRNPTLSRGRAFHSP